MIRTPEIIPATREMIETAAHAFRGAESDARSAELAAQIAIKEASAMRDRATRARNELAGILREAGFVDSAERTVAFPAGAHAYWADTAYGGCLLKAIAIAPLPARDEIEF